MGAISPIVQAEKLFLKDLFADTNTIIISQDHECTYSHDLTGATDFIQTRNKETPVYAPCDLKLIYSENILPGYGLKSTNTLMFQTAYGMELPDGSEKKICLALAHMEDTKYKSLGYGTMAKDATIKKGSILYYTGNKGAGSTGPHVHIRLADGDFKKNANCWYTVREDNLNTDNINEKRNVLNTTGRKMLTADQVFFADNMKFVYDKPSAHAENYNWACSK